MLIAGAVAVTVAGTTFEIAGTPFTVNGRPGDV
jgi:hypothetical protein